MREMMPARVDPDRGERVQVECPDCDQWVILAPMEEAIDPAIRAMERESPGSSRRLAALSVLSGLCSCGARLSLAITREKGTSQVAVA